MNDAAARFPESNSVLGSRRGEEVVHLLVDVLGPGQVLVALDLRLDQVVAVDGGGNGDLQKNIFERVSNIFYYRLQRNNVQTESDDDNH